MNSGKDHLREIPDAPRIKLGSDAAAAFTAALDAPPQVNGALRTALARRRAFEWID